MRLLHVNNLSRFTQLTHLFTTRHDGHSKPPFHSNNFGFHVLDDYQDVLLNHKALAQQLQYDHQQLVHMRQIHSNHVQVVDAQCHDFEHPPTCDALITNQKKIPLMVMTADCTPVLFYDPTHEAIGVAHVGRAGALQDIITETYKMMKKHYSSDVKAVRIAIGPSIGSCCYEVNESIAKEVIAAGYAFANQRKEGKYYLDVNAIIYEQLRRLGVTPSHIEDTHICSACENNTFFSYRADHQKTGRNAAVIMLR